ncbi:TPM domain-containing protein [Chitinimonas lacunae]|uniref:TPM domain-containing protein n=1 Tax=Chitinimonas lacunae TaxID=1963018 RepID=A0ABV8MTM6_9NEIS
MNERLAFWPWLAALLLSLTVLCQAAVPVPPLTARITDQTATLSAAQRETLDSKLAAFEARKGSQIAVLLVPSTGEESIEQYGIRVAEQWKLGRDQIDDGALLLIAKNDRALRIEVGYGLEGALTDATSKRIISDLITPHFQRGDFYGGIEAGIDAMIKVIDGEALPPSKRQASGRERESGGLDRLLPLLMIAVVAGAVLRSLLGRLPAALLSAGGAGALVWFGAGAPFLAVGAGLVVFFLTLLGLGSAIGFMGWHSGGGGGGGFHGGGGDFGGGGASGRW